MQIPDLHISAATVITSLISGTAGSTATLIYVAIWKHSPSKFPRTLDEWWAWARGVNLEIAAHSSAPLPIMPVEPAITQEGEKA